MLSLVAVLPAVAACDGGGGGGTTPVQDRAATRVARGLERVVGRRIHDVSCRRRARGGYRCTFKGERGCEVVDPIVRGIRVTGIDDGALADASVCAARRLAATAAAAEPAEVAETLRTEIFKGRWSSVFDSNLRRVACIREHPPHVTAQYRCTARAFPADPPRIAFVQSADDRIVAVWPLP